jgi:hypothetical protein
MHSAFVVACTNFIIYEFFTLCIGITLVYTGCAGKALTTAGWVGRSHHFQQCSRGHFPNFGFVSQKSPENHFLKNYTRTDFNSF